MGAGVCLIRLHPLSSRRDVSRPANANELAKFCCRKQAQQVPTSTSDLQAQHREFLSHRSA